MYIHNICAYTYVSRYKLLNLLNVTCVCVFSELSSWYWIAIGVLFPLENYVSHSQLSSVTCSSSCGVEAL